MPTSLGTTTPLVWPDWFYNSWIIHCLLSSVFIGLALYFIWRLRSPPLGMYIFISDKWAECLCTGLLLVWINVVASTVINCCVVSLQTLSFQSHCATGGVSGDAELAAEFAAIICFTIMTNISNPLWFFSCKLPVPSCTAAGTGYRIPRDLTREGQRLCRLHGQRAWLTQFYLTEDTCKVTYD